MAASLPIHLGITALFLCIVVPTSSDYCEKLSPKAGDKPLPEFNVTTFITEYKAVIMDKNYTMWARESFDSKTNFLRMDIKSHGMEEGLVIFNDKDAYISWQYLDETKEDGVCKVEELDKVKSDNLEMFGFTQKTGGKFFAQSAPEVLKVVKALGYEYVGQEELNGVAVDHWRSCQKWEFGSVTFTLDYYFTTENFKQIDSLTPKQIPVRAEVEGEMIKNGKTVHIHHIYDYVNFFAVERLPHEVYSLPDFLECKDPGLVFSNDPPTIGDSISYTVETVVHTPTDDDSEKVSVDVKTVYRDDQRQLLRVDSGKATSISDFKLGTEFLIDGDGCTARVIDPKNVPSAIKDGDNFIKIGDTPEMSYLKATGYFYSGTRTYRDISVYSFAKVMENEEIETFFNVDTLTPVGMRIKSLGTNVDTYYNFFNFVNFAYMPERDPFDIRGCEGDRTRVDYRITLKSIARASYNSHFTDYLPAIVEKIRDLVASLAGVSVLQIAPYDSVVLDDDLYLFVSYIGLTQSTPQAKVKNGLSVKTEREISSAVRKAIFDSTFQFTYYKSPNRFTFFATNMVTESSLISGQTTSRDYYLEYDNRCATDFDFTETSYETSALACADKCKNNYGLSCTFFQFTKATKACQMSAESVSPSTSNAIGCDSFALRAYWQFQIYRSTVLVRTADATIETGDANECARRCLDEKSFNCESFDLCEEDKKCALHATHYYSEESNPEKDESKYSKCRHYSRNSGYDYKYQGTMEITYPDEIVQTTASNGMECAYMCSDYGGEGCSMYNLCTFFVGDKREFRCNLVPTSMEASVETSTNKSCFLYKRKGFASGRSSSLNSIRSEGQTGYTGGEMVFLAIAMILTGVGAGVLTIFLLSWFNVWQG